ncbi:histidine kinase [Aquimarina sp. MMG016]|uniref:sensor histidine kinase n=1 Tax=Aquimarina sp. MMG016 TaxID=2822690 RepID=UPI001B3A2CA2|nr:histidine kinase [Aquimarina sp. MMG016]MBQ4820754.1 histidine kinase [Aquimarina sp. MMG016]
MNINRFLFYFLLCTLVNVVNFLRDLQDESVIEALKYVPYVFPTILTFTIGMYYLRSYILELPGVNKIIPKNKRSIKWGYWLLLITTKSVLFAIIAMGLSELFFPGYYNTSITSLFFWGNFTAVFCIILFVYVMEAFLESEAEKQEFAMKLNEIENERTLAKYQALKNQLNPHFLFNSFNSLSALIGIDTHKADDFLQQLSNIYRYNLDHSEDLVVSLDNEVKLIKSYMVMQHIRFRESIQITYQIDESKSNYLLPPMTLELLVENAIKHNIIEKTNPLYINVFTKGDYIIVENNYQPRGTAVNKEASFGIGLKNLKKQYELMHTVVPTFTIENNTYIARIPLITPDI